MLPSDFGNTPVTLFHRRYSSIAFLLFLIFSLVFTPDVVLAQAPPGDVPLDQYCLAIADERDLEGGGEDAQDTFTQINRITAERFIIGQTGTVNIEAMTFGPLHEVYAENNGRLGTIDLETGDFVPYSQMLGTGSGEDGDIGFRNLDGLAYSLELGILFGARRIDGIREDLLFAIDPYTGQHIPNYFGANIDYVPVEALTDDEGNLMADVDDMQFDPVTGILYAAMNTDGDGGNLVTIDIATGETTLVTVFTFADGGGVINDIEGLSFFNDGTMYASTGDNFVNAPANRNRLFRIDPTTGLGTLVGPLPTGPKDYEALACLSAEAAIVLKKYTNGPGQAPDDADEPTGPLIDVGATVTWTYTFTNTGVLTLTGLSLFDDHLGSVVPEIDSDCFNENTVLGPGASLTCFATATATSDQYDNLGTVTGHTTSGLPSFTVTSTNPSHYFGITPEVAALGDRVWHDLNANGVQDAGEPGVPNVTVNLLVNNCTEVMDSTTTDSDGIYHFVDLPPGTYCVQFDTTTFPQDFNLTQQNVGDDAADSDADPQSGESGTVTLEGGEVDPTLDAGLVQRTLQISAQPLCIQDAPYLQYTITPVNFTPGANPVTIRWIDVEDGAVLYEYTGQPLSNTLLWPEAGVDSNGVGIQWPGWSLVDGVWVDNGSNLRPQVRVEFSINPTNAVVVDYPPATPTCNTAPRAALGDFVWYDLNKNGLQDSSEAGVPGVKVDLYAGDGTFHSSLTTDSDGKYLFTGLMPGDYYVEFARPQGYSFTRYNVNGNSHDAADGDPIVPSVHLNIADGGRIAQVGEIVTYTLFYTNTDATLPAVDLIISTTIPAGTSFVGETSSAGWNCTGVTAGSVCLINLATLIANGDGTLTFVLLLDEDDSLVPGELVLLVRVTHSSLGRTEVVSLSDGETDLTVDAGVVLLEFVRPTRTSTGPTGLPPDQQPGAEVDLFLPSVKSDETSD